MSSAVSPESCSSRAGDGWFNESPVPHLLLAPDGRVQQLNQAALALFGVEARLALGRPLNGHLDSVSARHFAEHLAQVFETDHSLTVAVKLQPQGDRGIRHLMLVSRRLARPDGPVCLAAAIDLTEQQRLEEAKKQLERQLMNTQRLESLGQLAGGIAHDFNNLLTGILGHAELIEMSDDPTNSDRQSVAMIRKAATNAARLCQQMLASAGRSPGTLDSVDLNEAAADAVALVAVSLNKNITIDRRFAASLPAIRGDFAQLNQAILNLLINAEEAVGSEAGTIEIGTRLTRLEPGDRDASYFGPDVPAGEYVEVWVTDTGVGMSPVTLAHIFDPFYTTKFTGRGLGLSMVFGTVSWHNGTIAVRSAPGVGATFRLFLPAVQAAPRSPAPALPRVREARSLAGRRILLVEDEAPVRQVVSALLERAGATVTPVADGAAAVAQFREQGANFTHILLDLIMPGMTGEQTLEALQALGQPLPPVIVLSGYAGPDIQARLNALGVAGQLKKPCSLLQLTQEIGKS